MTEVLIIRNHSLIYSANQWTGFYMIGTSVVKELSQYDECCLFFVLHKNPVLCPEIYFPKLSRKTKIPRRVFFNTHHGRGSHEGTFTTNASLVFLTKIQVQSKNLKKSPVSNYYCKYYYCCIYYSNFHCKFVLIL